MPYCGIRSSTILPRITTLALPYFAELKPYLLEARNQAEEQATYVVDRIVANRQRSGRQGRNLRKPFQDFIRRAGNTLWPKPFQNLRVTRENELERQFSPNAVQSWIGHTRRVAEKSYLVVTDGDFDKAIGTAGGQSVISQWSANRSTRPYSLRNKAAIPAISENCSLFLTIAISRRMV